MYGALGVASVRSRSMQPVAVSYNGTETGATPLHACMHCDPIKHLYYQQ